MGNFFEVLSDPINKVYINGTELEKFGTININRSSISGLTELDLTSDKPSVCDCGVIFNGELHFIGSSKADKTVGMHCKWDGTTWTSNVTTLPYNPAYCGVIVYNDEIHIFGGHPSSLTTSKNYASQKYHYKLNKDTNVWEKVSSLPYYFFGGSAVIYNGEIHLLGGGRTSTTRRKHVYLNSKKAWKSSTSLSQLLRGYQKAFTVMNSNGEETLYFCGEQSFSNTEKKRYPSKLYYYDKKKKKWVQDANFSGAITSKNRLNYEFAYLFAPFGGEVYTYAWGIDAQSSYIDCVKRLRFDSSTSMLTNGYDFTDNLFDADIGPYSNMFFFDNKLMLFKEDGNTMKTLLQLYTITIE